MNAKVERLLAVAMTIQAVQNAILFAVKMDRENGANSQLLNVCEGLREEFEKVSKSMNEEMSKELI